jgi:hypothetical protein
MTTTTTTTTTRALTNSTAKKTGRTESARSTKRAIARTQTTSTTTAFAVKCSSYDCTDKGREEREEDSLSMSRRNGTTRSIALAVMIMMSSSEIMDSANAAQVVDWLQSGAEATPEELMRIMKESAKQDWDPALVKKRDNDHDASSSSGSNMNNSMNSVNKMYGVSKDEMNSGGNYDIDAPIASGDTVGRLGKFGLILVGADFVTAFVMGKSVLGVAKNLEKKEEGGEEEENLDWKEKAANAVMNKLKAKAEDLKNNNSDNNDAAADDDDAAQKNVK